MSTSTIITSESPSRALVAKLSDYLELTKPRIVLLELIVASAAACLAAPHTLDMQVLLFALAGTGLVAASASIANQWWERSSDAHMPRTEDRPLPAGRVSSAEAILLSLVTLLAGMAILVWRVNMLTALLGLASWMLYVVIYTPLKTRSSFNTTVGAVAGAIPIIMGWTATGTPLGLNAWSLAGVLFLWQFPHFMAIAWIYRHDYAAAGHRMLTVVDPSGMRAGAQAVLGAAVLIPVSLIPAVVPTSGSPLLYLTWSFTLGTILLGLSIRFAIFRDEISARFLLRASLIYLPAWLAMLLVVTL
ncbi:heme o synthase [Bythopirellula polymerisocia]|uniref:Protoheme IX farnesyltransferase n=1 Tax=Bythopirellula polymerisocia TaxID=2528003 RepID=A0A5C6CJN4_9BACT|nr:heme o synthase [Bythopirellula polymerisocia]TWU23561.1 Protoheme IX farnesyltransferase 2 [Bythopirellula polymerisocia]